MLHIVDVTIFIDLSCIKNIVLLPLKPNSQSKFNQLKGSNLLFIDCSFNTGTKEVEGAKDVEEIRDLTIEL